MTDVSLKLLKPASVEPLGIGALLVICNHPDHGLRYDIVYIEDLWNWETYVHAHGVVCYIVMQDLLGVCAPLRQLRSAVVSELKKQTRALEAISENFLLNYAFNIRRIQYMHFLIRFAKGVNMEDVSEFNPVIEGLDKLRAMLDVSLAAFREKHSKIPEYRSSHAAIGAKIEMLEAALDHLESAKEFIEDVK